MALVTIIIFISPLQPNLAFAVISRCSSTFLSHLHQDAFLPSTFTFLSFLMTSEALCSSVRKPESGGPHMAWPQALCVALNNSLACSVPQFLHSENERQQAIQDLFQLRLGIRLCGGGGGLPSTEPHTCVGRGPPSGSNIRFCLGRKYQILILTRLDCLAGTSRSIGWGLPTRRDDLASSCQRWSGAIWYGSSHLSPLGFCFLFLSPIL